MGTMKWTKEESILVLNLYFTKPVGIKDTKSDGVKELASLVGRTPSAVHRRMYGFLRWYPTIPLLYCEETVDESSDDTYQPFWNAYFLDPKLLAKDAGELLKAWRAGILALDLYYRLIPDTMMPKVPEVVELAKQTKTTPQQIVDALHDYLACDPFTKGKSAKASEKPSTRNVLLWNRFANKPNLLKNAVDAASAAVAPGK